MNTAPPRLLALVAAACCAAPPSHAAPAGRPAPSPPFHVPLHVVYVSEAYDGRTVTLPYGERLAALVSSQSTPADWAFIPDPKTPLREVKDAEDAPPTPSHPSPPGSRHTVTYFFTVARPAPVRRACLLRFNLQDRGPRPRYVLQRWRIKVVIPAGPAVKTP